MRKYLGRYLAVAIGLLVVAHVHGQVEGASYTGNRLCVACHRRTEEAIVNGYLSTAHAKAMQEATDETVVADFANAPFGRDQVKYVLGIGRHQQAYLDAELKVLPAYWNVDDKAWVAHEAADGATECVGCHTTGFDPATRQWSELGVGCERCHGPGSKHNTARREDRAATTVNPANLDPHAQAAVCGQCHSTGRSSDGTYAFPHGFSPGMDLAAMFTDAKPTEAGRNQQYSELMQSPAHWDAGVVCEKCHDPHGDTEQPYQLRMGINETCLQCHAEVGTIAEHTQHKGVEAPADATCATCHMPDGRHLFDKTIAGG